MKSLELKTRAIGVLPIIDRFLMKLEVRKNLRAALGRETYVDAIELLVKNLLVRPEALYRIREWSERFEPCLVYGAKLGDDAIGRALDRLFEADRASLMTRLVVGGIKAFQLDTSQIHNDTTSVKFFGTYAAQHRTAVALKRGLSKDHRPDLLQLVYCLSVTADGGVPVHFKTYDGNRTDDTMHWETWQSLRGILGRSDFLYVADCKLCVSETLMNLDRAQGRFITILPRTRQETRAFSDRVAQSAVRWTRIYSKRSSRKYQRHDVFECAAELYQMREGFRLYWYRSSEKMLRDERDRTERLRVATHQLGNLNAPNRRGPKTEAALRRAADKIVARHHAQEWIHISIRVDTLESFKQASRGKPSTNTVYRRVLTKVHKISWTLDPQAINRNKAMDGIFPLATNTKLSALDVLKAYKYQPKVEKRHSLLKSLLEIAPVFLKKNQRIDALVFAYFVAQWIASLVERSVRQAMAKQGIDSLPLLPEERPTKTPSPEQIFRAFEHRAKHELYSQGRLVKTFADPLTSLQAQLLAMLDVPENCYIDTP